MRESAQSIKPAHPQEHTINAYEMKLRRNPEKEAQQTDRYPTRMLTQPRRSQCDGYDDSAFHTFGGDMGNSVKRLPVA